MASTLYPGNHAPILAAHPSLEFRDGAYRYTIANGVYTVADGKETLTAPVAWAFGQGTAGQTYAFERNGAWYESRVSFYADTNELGLTLGARNSTPRNIVDAAGRQMTPKDATACFGCHSWNAVREAKLDLAGIVSGVQCESCHDGAARHAAAVKAGDVRAAALPSLAKLPAEEVSELCGRCHRTWADIAANGPIGVQNVRFQPYRLANSKCYDAVDRRISCVACHDPHGEVERRAEAYDKNCVACHAAGMRARVCSTAKSACTSCHMPKIEIPGSHHKFSDHQIRIVRANETYPN
jgi:hypothetical protein